MKTLIQRLTATYQNLKLLSDPSVSELLTRELASRKSRGEETQSISKPESRINFSPDHIYFHEHFIVQVVS